MNAPNDKPELFEVADLNLLANTAHESADALVRMQVNPAFMFSVDAAERSDAFRQLMMLIRQGDDGGPIDDYLQGGHVIDDHLDVAKIRIAQRFFEEHGVNIITALFFAALPEAYLGRRGVQVLDITGELVSNWNDRITSTGQMLITVMSPDPMLLNGDITTLHSGQSAAVLARRVSLVHAGVRLFINQASSNETYPIWLPYNQQNRSLWQSRMVEAEEDAIPSKPLCQEDMLATLTTFTTVTLEAIAKLGIHASDEETDAFHHLWNIIGWHLGIGDAESLSLANVDLERQATYPYNSLLPLSPTEMNTLTAQLRDRLQSASPAGERLTRALVRELKTPLPRQLRNTPDLLIRYLIGDEGADRLGVDEGGYVDLAVRKSGLLRRAAQLTRHTHLSEIFVEPVSKMITRYALRAFVTQARGGANRGLEIPPTIAAQWGVQTAPERDPMPTTP